MTARDGLELATASPEETERVGLAVGAVLEAGDLVALDGVLGAGKTCFVRGLALGAGADPAAVRSPTFVLHHVYRGRRLVLHHVDLYRLGEGVDVDALDIDSLLDGGAVAVEWASHADLRRLDPVEVHIEAGGPADRMLRLAGRVPERIARAWSAAASPAMP